MALTRVEWISKKNRRFKKYKMVVWISRKILGVDFNFKDELEIYKIKDAGVDFKEDSRGGFQDSERNNRLLYKNFIIIFKRFNKF